MYWDFRILLSHCYAQMKISFPGLIFAQYKSINIIIKYYYLTFKPDDVNAQDEVIRAMEDCIKDIRNWLIEGRLLLNDDKTEFLVIGTCQQLNKLNPSVLRVGDHTIDPSVNVRNLGTRLDNSISMDTHINQVRKTDFYHIHNIHRISKYL